MRIRVEYEDGPVFSTIQHPTQGRYRAMMVKIDGKPFTAWRTVDDRELFFRGGDERYMEEIDKLLLATMERMLAKVFMDACAAVEEGTDLLES